MVRVIRRTTATGGIADPLADPIAEEKFWRVLCPAKYDKSSKSLTRGRAAEMVYGSSQVGEI